MQAASSKSVLSKFNHAVKLDQLAPGPRRVVVGVIGGTVVLIGVALIFLPGPAFVVIPLGLAILASEFAWARRWLEKARSVLKRKKKRN